MTEGQPGGVGELVSVFAIPDGKASSTLEAIEAMNRAGGDIFTLKPEGTAAAGTLSGTGCQGTSGSPSGADFACSDTDR
jgi:hypothetical protein